MSMLKVSIRQVKAARALLAWSQEQMAEKRRVDSMIKRLESEDGPLGGREVTGARICSPRSRRRRVHQRKAARRADEATEDDAAASVAVEDLNSENDE